MSIRIDTADFSKKMKNAMDYSNGFFDGVQMEKITFMRFLGGYVREALYKYIDARARSNPDALHHVYEPGAVGSSGARLYQFDIVPRINSISFNGKFLPSSVPSLYSNEPFVDKATVMENGIAITVEPRNSDVLVFEIDGETVFSRRAITIEHPGGDAVAGAFGRVVDQFFTQYFTNALLRPIFDDLKTADEFVAGFGRGGRSQGVAAGKRYMTIKGIDFE